VGTWGGAVRVGATVRVGDGVEGSGDGAILLLLWLMVLLLLLLLLLLLGDKVVTAGNKDDGALVMEIFNSGVGAAVIDVFAVDAFDVDAFVVGIAVVVVLVVIGVLFCARTTA